MSEETSLPYPHRNGTFSYKTINKKVQNVLDLRSRLDNTTQISMPFIKATTTLDMGTVLGTEYAGYHGFTLGIHSTAEDLKYKDIYSSNDGDYLIGYTYNKSGNGEVKNVYTKFPESVDSLVRILDTDVAGRLYSGDDPRRQAVFIPPPGITSANISRYRDGRVAMAQLNFTVPTLPQLEILHRTFLVPGLGTVVEWGQQFAPRIESAFEEPLSPETLYFPWHRPVELEKLFERLGKKQVGVEEILRDYTYPSNGNYSWMFGEIGNFSVKANSDGSYECQAKVIGPSEASWAYSVVNTVLPVRNYEDTICAKTYSVYEYLRDTTPESTNLKTLLTGVNDGELLPDWTDHVIRFENGNARQFGEGGVELSNRQGGDSTTPEANDSNRTNSVLGNDSFGDDDDAYYMSWRFFVNVVLNDETYGIKSVFKNAGMTDDELAKIGLLRPYKEYESVLPIPSRQPSEQSSQSLNQPSPFTAPTLQTTTASPTSFVDPYECYVGYNQYLRSIDIGTMIIVNETAVDAAKQYMEDNGASPDVIKKVFSEGNISKGGGGIKLKNFFIRTGEFGKVDDDNDKGFLSTGVWINHKAVVNTLAASETLLIGLSNLLQRMNTATSNYWNLMIDESVPTKFNGAEELSTENEPYSYAVVDANYHENSTTAVTNFLRNVYIFNKYIRDRNGLLVGSESIDASVELSLPQTLFSQIATLGLVQQEDLDERGGEGAGKRDSISIGVNDTLRRMFAITSLTLSTDPQKNPDLTKRVVKERDLGVCGSTFTSTELSGGKGVGGSTSIVVNEILTRNEMMEQFSEPRSVTQTTASTREQELRERLRELTDRAQSGGEIAQKNNALSLARASARNAIANFNRGRITEAERDRQISQANENIRRLENELEQLNTEKENIEQLISVFDDRSSTSVDERINAASTILRTRCETCIDPVSSRFSSIPTTGFTPLTADVVDGIVMSSPIPPDVSSPTSSPFGAIRNGTVHGGIDIALPVGTPILAAHDGVVIGLSREDRDSRGIFIEIQSQQNNKWKTRYLHLDSISSTVLGGEIGIGTRIARGQRIGFSGNTGSSSGPHLHFDIINVNNSTDRVDPTSIFQTNAPVVLNPAAPARIFKDTPECAICNEVVGVKQRLETLKEQQQRTDRITSAAERAIRNFNNLNGTLRYHEILPDIMVSRIARDSNEERSNAFGAAPGTLSIKANLKLPGIAGLRIGELFWIDRIPLFYRAFGAFQIMTIEDNISLGGWTTNIDARFNYLGAGWKRSVVNILNGEGQ